MLGPVHRKLYQLLTAGKLKECARILGQHLEDSESRLSRVVDNHKLSRSTPARAPRAKTG